MKLSFNEDRHVVEMIRAGLAKKQGHCPCTLEQTEDTMCMCRQFREQVADPEFEGYCHCMLYYKEK